MTHPAALVKRARGEYDGETIGYALALVSGWDRHPDYPLTTPSTTAACSIYIALFDTSHKHHSQSEVAEVFDISEQTIKNNYDALFEYKKLVV